ncbi:hypothetical protein BH24CHL4_BH24CHL4_13650 [soil metagenome]
MAASDPSSVAELIRAFRLRAGLSQEELAERSGVSTRAISDIERGLRPTPRLETVRMLSDALCLTDDQRAGLIAAARPELREAATGTTARIHDAGQTLSSLPTPPTTLIGRDTEVAELMQHATRDARRLITLTGPGGVGKTRLAVELAHRVAAGFPGGAFFVNLAPVVNAEMVASAIAQTLGIPETGDRPLHHILRYALAARPRLLLLLDNFEQVIDAAPLVADLVLANPALLIIVTSREPLRVRGELEFETLPLVLPDAGGLPDPEQLARISSVALFARSAQAVNTAFNLSDDNAPAIAEICRRLDGLPLAIELAAARVRHFSPEVLLQHLDRRLPLLTGGPRDLPARQQTIRDTISWSYDLLSQDEQALYRRFGVFAGGASLEAIADVAWEDTDSTLLPEVASLVDKHLLQERVDEGGSPRFSMLELIREFAIEQLHHQQEYDIVRHAHARHFLQQLRTANSTWAMSLREFPGQDIFRSNLDNIRAAFDWYELQGDAESCARIIDAIWGHYYVDGHFYEALSLGNRVLALANDQPLSDALQASVLGTRSISASVLGDHAAAVSYGEQAFEAARRLPPESGLLPLCLIALAIAWRDQHRFAEATVYAEQALPAARVPGIDEYVEPHVLYHLGRLAYLQNDLERAADYLEASLRQIRSLGPTETALYTINALAEVRIRLGNLADAASLLREGHSLLPPGGFSGLWFDAAVLLAAGCDLRVPAVHMLGYYSSYLASIGIRDIPFDPWMAETIKSLRNEPGEIGFESAYEAGAALTAGEAIGLALDVLDRAEEKSAPSAKG